MCASCDGVARGRRFAEYSVASLRETSVATGWVGDSGVDGYWIHREHSFPPGIMIAPACLHLVLLHSASRMGPVHDRRRFYGPVTDQTHSLCSSFRQSNNCRESAKIFANFRIRPCIHRSQGIPRRKRRCGNTFKATAKPVLIGTAVVGATTMIFFNHRFTHQWTAARAHYDISISHPPFLLA